MQQDKEDRKGDNWRAWLRWAGASVVGGVVSSVIAYVGASFLINVFHPQPIVGLDIAGAVVALTALIFSITIGGIVGGLLHWRMVGRRYRRSAWWTVLFWVAFIIVTIASEQNYIRGVQIEDILEALIARVGLAGMSAIVGAPLGLVIGTVLAAIEYMRSRHHAPGP